MKKHDEGYVLAYVTVVLLVFCLVATAILTGAHRNLQSQQAANERMKDQYIAAGMIEKVVAQWEEINWSAYMEAATPIGNTGALYMDQEDGAVLISATHGTVTITCQVKNGNYLTYDVSITEPAPSTIGGGDA